VWGPFSPAHFYRGSDHDDRDRGGGRDSGGDQEALDFMDHGVAVEWYNAINPFDQQV